MSSDTHEHPTDPAETAAAWNLAVGVAVYLAGEAAFRYVVGLGPAHRRRTGVGRQEVVHDLGVQGGAQPVEITGAAGVVVADDHIRVRGHP